MDFRLDLQNVPSRKTRKSVKIEFLLVLTIYFCLFQELQIYLRSIWVTRGSGGPRWTAPGSSAQRWGGSWPDLTTKVGQSSRLTSDWTLITRIYHDITFRKRKRYTSSFRCTSWRSLMTATSISSRSLTRRRTSSTGRDTSVAQWQRPTRVRPMYFSSGKNNLSFACLY